ncbi:MAG: hypothetical protein LUC20_01280, partial [Oscillospiraceae bacterium]|nr:hypothetical protein [Oscillospiraceae bacterium]
MFYARQTAGGLLGQSRIYCARHYYNIDDGAAVGRLVVHVWRGTYRRGHYVVQEALMKIFTFAVPKFLRRLLGGRHKR